MAFIHVIWKWHVPCWFSASFYLVVDDKQTQGQCLSVRKTWAKRKRRKILLSIIPFWFYTMKSYLNVPDSSADDSFLPPWVGFWVYIVYAAGVFGTMSASDCCTMKMNSNGKSSRRAIHYLADTAYIISSVSVSKSVTVRTRECMFRNADKSLLLTCYTFHCLHKIHTSSYEKLTEFMIALDRPSLCRRWFFGKCKSSLAPNRRMKIKPNNARVGMLLNIVEHTHTLNFISMAWNILVCRVSSTIYCNVSCMLSFMSV